MISSDRLVFRSEPDNYYVKLNKKDRDLFQSYVLEDPTPITEVDDLIIKPNYPRLKKAKLYFFKKIIDQLFNRHDGINELYKILMHIIKKLIFIVIKVKSDYDAYLLFESLNSKGLDLSTSDLLKNKMLMTCNNSDALKDSVLGNWDLMVKNIQYNTEYESPVEFIRFYWLAFYNKNITKKELYKDIKKEIDKSSFKILSFSEDLKEKAETFAILLDKERLFPTTLKPGTLEQYLSEISTLKYMISIPLFLKVFYKRPHLLDKIVYNSLIYLFRVITIGEYSVGAANDVFNKMLDAIESERTDSEILEIFIEDSDKISDKNFKENMMLRQFNNNSIAKYIIMKLHIYKYGWDLIPNPNEVHLEHVLPQQPQKWIDNGFDRKDKKIEDWIYNIGNMILLNKKSNSRISNSLFNDKMKEFKESIIDSTEDFYKSYNDKDWNTETIINRASDIAEMATKIWKFEL